ncbi:MAG: hypothetical protein U9O94_06970 [Nanoarchaeota archaeon]|nr:hypothetical protein [Nanoarchaeota archaeon]
MDQSVFEGFIGKEVKAPYRDGSQFKIARGVLDSISNGFIRISGKLGTIIINEKNIEKMSRVSVRGASRENGESRAS